MATVTGTRGFTMYEDTIAKTTGGSDLGKEDFLKLLVAQLTQQDPTNPMSDTEFVSQLATYSSLEQQMNTNKNLETLIAANRVANVSAATACIGKLVGYVDSNGVPQAKLVEFIDIYENEINLFFSDGTYIPFSKVEQIADPMNNQSSSGNSDAPSSGGDDDDSE